MNPLVLSGPQFLAFYAVFALVVLLLIVAMRRALERGTLPRIELRDPYLFACLSGGPAEVVRVSTLDLVDRGLLTVTGDTARLARADAPALSQRPIERSILGYFRRGASLSSAARDKDLQAAAGAEYEPRLRGVGLLPSAAAQRVRRIVLGCAIVALVGMGLAKIVVALRAGKGNIELLLLLTAASVYIATRIWNPYRTPLGDDYLTSVKSLFDGLRQRAAALRPGGGNRDLVWLTALFGVAALPATEFPAAAHVRPKSEGGSGCGGGGCGGGGGGCGGCGGGGGG
jgi:uncharacterized protein (TIGR04222 family)